MAITNHRQPDDLVDAFGTAETLLRERQVSGNAQHHGVVEARGALIELAYRHRAGRRVDRRKAIEDLALAGVGRRRDILEIGADQLEARRRSEEHTSELQSLMRISYAVFCLNKNTNQNRCTHTRMKTHTNTNHT